MRKNLIEKILHICFMLNLFLILIFIGQLVVLLSNSDWYFDTLTDHDKSLTFNLIFYFFYIPSFILWLHNIHFFYKYDRYSKSIILLFLINILYSPYYYYQVKIKKRPLKNEIKKEPAIGNTVLLEDYENESDFQNDINEIENETSN